MMQLEYSNHLKSIIAHATVSIQNQTNVLKRIDVLSAKSKKLSFLCLIVPGVQLQNLGGKTLKVI